MTRPSLLFPDQVVSRLVDKPNLFIDALWLVSGWPWDVGYEHHISRSFSFKLTTAFSQRVPDSPSPKSINTSPSSREGGHEERLIPSFRRRSIGRPIALRRLDCALSFR